MFHHQNKCDKLCEIAMKKVYNLNTDVITNEEAYVGFCTVCTNLEDVDPANKKINHNRWEIRECFRLLKIDFKARLVYLSRDDRI